MIKKLLLSLLGVVMAFALLAMKRSGEEHRPPLMLSQQHVKQAGITKLTTSSPTNIAAGGDVACALLSCPAVLSVTD